MENGGIPMSPQVSFMQFCSMVARFTKTISISLDSIYQLVIRLQELDRSDIEERKIRQDDMNDEIRGIRDNTASVLAVLKSNFLLIKHLPPSQQLVLNFTTALLKLIISFSNAARKLEERETIDKLYKDILSSAKQTVSAINFSLKGIFSNRVPILSTI